MTRDLRFQYGLPTSYWGHLINILPTHVLNHLTPHEVLFHSKPDYSTLRAFGCLCYASVHSNDKLFSRAIQCVFLGYPHLKKGFKLLRLDNKSVMVSRHVKFLEHIFPYHNVHSSDFCLNQFNPHQKILILFKLAFSIFCSIS